MAKTKREYNIFGIETDASVQARADAEKKQNYQKLAEIIDKDMLGYVTCYGMLDKMAFKKTQQDKKDFIISYVRNEVTLDRKPNAISSGGFNNRLCARKEYINQPIDENKLKLLADYILDVYKNNDGVKYYRVGPDSGFTYYDANGVDVCKTRWSNKDVIQKYLCKVIRQKYPQEKYPQFYFSTKYSGYNDRKGTYDDVIISSIPDTDLLRERARKLAQKDPEYINFVPVQ